MWSVVRRHLSYANIVATLALVFSMSAGAVAATHYVINSTKQINPKVLKKLKGKTGATGATGAQGPGGKEGSPGKTGSAGVRGPASTAFTTNSGSNILLFQSASGGAATVSLLSLPAGTFSVSGKLIADNDGPWALIRCELILGETTIDPGFDGVKLGEHPADRHSIVLSGTGSLSTPGTAKIICNSPPETEGKYKDRSITAIQVGSLG